MQEKTKDGQDIVNGIVGNVPPGKQTLVDVAKAMVGDKEEMTFIVENRDVQPEQPKLPPKMESPRRSHVFHDVDGFAAYLTKYKTKNTVVLADVGKQVICAILDEKAETGFEIITLRPGVHPLFEPWRVILNSDRAYTGLREFAEFLSENRRSIVEPDGKSLVMMLSQVKVSKKTTLQKGFGKHAVNGIVCEMDIMGETKSEEIELPDTITIQAPLCLATEPVRLEIDIIIGANDTEVFVKCRSADMIQECVAVFDKLLERVRAIDGVVVALGGPAYHDWLYLDDRTPCQVLKS